MLAAMIQRLLPFGAPRIHRGSLACADTLLALALLLSMLIATGCGSTCREIREHREGFDARRRTTNGPDARLSIPFSLMDRVLDGRLARRPPLPVPLPTGELGLPLSLSLSIDRVTTHAAGAGQLGMTVALGLVDTGRGRRVLELEVDTTITPRLALAPGREPELSLRLRPQDLGRLRPRATPEGAAALAGWLRDALPSYVRALATDEVVHALADESLAFIAQEVWPHHKERLLGTEPLVDSRFALPDLPIRELSLRSEGGALVVSMTTDLPDAEPLRGPDAAPPRPTSGRAADRMLLQLSGGTATGLINRAMDRGQVPSRFAADGTPDPDGIWEARVGWRGGSSPLTVHLWRTHEGCRRAEVAARLALALQGDTVRVRVHEGRFTTVAGPAFAEAFAWLEGLFGDAMSYTFDTGALVRFEAGDDQVQLRLAQVAIGEDDLLLHLDLGVAGRPR